MLTYDLDLNAWVRKPGSASPPWSTPVLTVGAVWSPIVQFYRGETPEDMSGADLFLGLKLAGDYGGSYVASDNAPSHDGSGGIIFALDLGTTAGKAYFTANPHADTVVAALQVEFTVGSVKTKTVPLTVVLQNDYIPDK